MSEEELKRNRENTNKPKEENNIAEHKSSEATKALDKKENQNKPQRESVAVKKSFKRKKSPLRSFFKIFASILVSLILVVLVWTLYCMFDSKKIEEYVPEGFSFYASAPSASKLLNETLGLQALDEVFAGTDLADIYSTIKMLRANKFISSNAFSFLANVRSDLVLYSEAKANELYIFADLGIRSALTRLIPIALNVNPSLLDDIDALRRAKDAAGDYFAYKISADSEVYFRFYKNIFIAKLSSSKNAENEFVTVLNTNDRKFQNNLIKDLSKCKKASLNILADLNFAKPSLSASNEVLEKILKELDFTERSVLNIEVKNSEAKLSGDIKLKSENKNIQAILSHRASVPKTLNRIPESTEYFTLFNFTSPENLLKNLDEFLSYEIKQNYRNADRYMKMLFSKNIEELLLSWIGDEIGVFALNSVDAPVFFTSIKNKQKCKDFFDTVFKSILIDQNSSTVVDGVRISRIDFPPVVEGLLKLFKINLPKPFYFIDGDFVFFSESSEGIARTKLAYDNGSVITKNENWRSMLKNVSSETSYMLYYDLDRTVPNFLKENKTLAEILSHYGRGLFSFKLGSEQDANFAFYAVKKERKALKRISSFPKQLEGTLYGNLHFAKNKNGAPYIFWSTGDTLYSYNLENDKVQRLNTDSKTTITLETDNDKLVNLWALSKNGSVYKMDENLNSKKPYPILTSYKSIGELVLFKDKVIFSAQNTPNIVMIENDGTIKLSDDLVGKMTRSPLTSDELIIALPRSFDSQVQFLDLDGKLSLENIELLNISAIQPLIFASKNKKDIKYIANFTEDGVYTLHSFDGKKTPTTIAVTELHCSVRIQPIYSESLNAIILLDTDGMLRLLNINGEQKLSVKIANSNEKMQITVKDINGDRIDEIFISGAGNAIYGYSSTLNALEGFPIAGLSNPIFVDVNSDGSQDILSFGLDSKLYAVDTGKNNF